MLRLKIMLLTAVITVGQWAAFSDTSDAGPLLDWLRNACRRPVFGQNVGANNNGNCCQPAAQQIAAAAPATYDTSGYDLQPGQCRTTCQKTCQRTVVNYVPTTSYRTSWDRVPVTQYRPETKSDPCTGCSVTCMKPCTTYTYRMKRVPYTSYKPVYRTETYKVPVTYVTNNCATGGCATCPTATPAATSCDSCGIAATSSAPAPVYSAAPTYGGGSGTIYSQPTVTTAPSGTINTGGGFQTQGGGFQTQGGGLPTVDVSPAELSPSLNPQNTQRRPVYEYTRPAVQGSATRMQLPISNDFGNENWTSTGAPPKPSSNPEWDDQAPAQFGHVDKLAKSNIRREWNYSPAKAAYASIENEPKAEVVEYRGQFSTVQPKPKAMAKVKAKTKTTRKVNSGWETVDW